MKNVINVIWSGPHKPNWGDELNKTLVQHLSGSEVHYGTHVDSHYLCIGSILRLANKNSIVWGSGFIKENEEAAGEPDVRAVRGPLSRQKLLDQGYKCPEVYGDPALLYPKFYNPKITKKYKIGIIPHYADQEHKWLKQFKDDPAINIINILNTDVEKLVDEVKKCDVILSSSLHGIVCGDAYGIPSYWVELSDNVIGEGFKFRDYFLSVKRNCKPMTINKNTDIKLLKFDDYKIDIDLDLLLNACPFYKTPHLRTRDFNQCQVGPWVKSFKDDFMNRWSFKEYSDVSKPVVFFGINEQYELINNHTGPKILITSGPADLPKWSMITNRKNLFLMSSVDKLDSSTPADVIFKRELLELKDFSLFKPNVLGDKIYFYSGYGNGFIGGPDLKSLQRNVNYEFITTPHKSLNDYFSISHLKEHYYDKSFMSINWSPGMGMTTLRELGLMGRKTAMNPINYTHSFGEAVVPFILNDAKLGLNKIIEKEAKKIGTVQPSINLHTLTTDEWLYFDYWNSPCTSVNI